MPEEKEPKGSLSLKMIGCLVLIGLALFFFVMASSIKASLVESIYRVVPKHMWGFVLTFLVILLSLFIFYSIWRGFKRK
jgi:hypothetical protein